MLRVILTMRLGRGASTNNFAQISNSPYMPMGIGSFNEPGLEDGLRLLLQILVCESKTPEANCQKPDSHAAQVSKFWFICALSWIFLSRECKIEAILF